MAVGHRSYRDARRARHDGEALRRSTHGVAVTHPGPFLSGEALEDPGTVTDLHGRGAVLALSLRHDVAPQKVRHELHPVADAEDGKVSRDDARIDARSARLIQYSRTRRQDTEGDVAAHA